MKRLVIYLLVLVTLSSCCSSPKLHSENTESYHLQVFSEDVEVRKDGNAYVVDVPSSDTTFELQVRNCDGWWISSISVKNPSDNQFVPQYKDRKFYHGPLKRYDGWYEFEANGTKANCHIYNNTSEKSRELKLCMTEGDFLAIIYIVQAAPSK